MDVLLLKQFLLGKLNFKQGVELYKKCNGSPVLIKLFATEDAYSSKKLKSEIQRIYDAETAKHQAVKTKPSNGKKKANKINPESLPYHLRLEYERLNPIIREISYKHAKLEEKQNDGDRYILAKEIVDLVALRREIFSRIDYFNEFGKDIPGYDVVKEPETLKETPYFEALHKLQLLRVRRTKLKNNPARIRDFEKVVNDIKILQEIVKKKKQSNA